MGERLLANGKLPKQTLRWKSRENSSAEQNLIFHISLPLRLSTAATAVFPALFW